MTPATVSRLTGGCIADVFRVRLPDGADIVAKYDTSQEPRLDREGYMLRELARAGAPVPRVISASPRLLLMEHIPNNGRRSQQGETELANIIADLHEHTATRYGLEHDTLIGPLDQPNPRADHWPALYAEHRLLYMTQKAAEQDTLPIGTAGLITAICERIDTLIPEPNPPALIHGDLWAGNVLWLDGSPAAIIDPATYHADREIELAFIDLMGNVGPGFWEAYEQRFPIAPGFWEIRRDLYAMYPLLVHATLFGGTYGQSVHTIASRLI